MAVSLLLSDGGYLPRVLLLAGAARLVLIVPATKDDQLARLTGLLDSVDEIAVRDREGFAVVTGTRTQSPTQPVTATLRRVIDHPHAILGSAWHRRWSISPLLRARA